MNKKQKIYLKILFVLCSLTVLNYRLKKHPYSKKEQEKLRTKMFALQQELNKKQILKEQLNWQAHALKTNSFYQEKIAREELFLVKKNEIVLQKS